MSELDRIVDTARDEVRRRMREVPQSELEAQLSSRDERPFSEALIRPGVSIIAEHKRRSPSAGDIRPGSSVTEVVCAYEAAGAAALSILTEGPNFGGSLADLSAARAALSLPLPLLRKDFVVDPYQVHEAYAAGADAILLIVAALDDEALADLHALAGRVGLDALVEVHDETELRRALAIGAEIVGVNNRDLTTLAVDTERTYELRALIPAGTAVVAESGFSRPEQLARLAAAGVDAVLIGEALMRSEDLEGACRALS